MSAKFLRRETALKCPVHIIIRASAAKFLEDSGAFSQEEVLEATRMGAMCDSIRWDYVREQLEDEQGCELIPVSPLYFKGLHTKDRKEFPLAKYPEKYIASGNGKRTAGYASVTIDENAKLVLTRLKQLKGLSNGVGKAFNKFVEEVKRKGSFSVQMALAEDEQKALTTE